MRERDDHAIFELVKSDHAKCGKVPKITVPSKVLEIRDRDELKAQLNHYAAGIMKLMLPDSNFARKHYVEKIRPALRYYCNKFNVPVPHWLVDEKRYLDMPDHVKIDYFGTTEIKPREFQKIKTDSKVEE